LHPSVAFDVSPVRRESPNVVGSNACGVRWTSTSTGTQEVVMLEYEELKNKVAEVEEDLLRAEQKGNKAAGTRVRKAMQEIKKISQAIRVKVLELRGE